MKAAGIKEGGFDTEKGQVIGRTAIRPFIATPCNALQSREGSQIASI